jgi:hypothetical protein
VPQISFRVLSYVFLIAVGLQFFFAGLNVMGGESIDMHRGFGFSVMHLLPLLMFGAAIWAKMGRVTITIIVVLFVLVVIQSFFADEGLDPQWLRSLHVLNGLFIAAVGYHIAQRSGPIRIPREA